MPPYGLYRIPRQHLYGTSTPMTRPAFNTKEFQDNTMEAVTTADGRADPPLTGAAESKGSGRVKRDKKEKKHKKQSLEAQGKQGAEKLKRTSAATATDTIPAASSSKAKNSKDKKKKKKTGDAGTSGKKRKRESGAQTEMMTASGQELNNSNSVFGAGFLQNLKATMGDLGANFTQQVNTKEPSEKPKKKKRKSSNEGAKGDAVGEVNSIIAGEDKGEKKKKDKPIEGLSVNDAGSPIKTPVPLPSLSAPKKTPVPLPQNPPHPSDAARERQENPAKVGGADSHIPVTETPPSQIARTPAGGIGTPIPFNLRLTSATITPVRKKPKKGPTINISTPTTVQSSETPASAVATLLNCPNGISGSQISLHGLNASQNSLTSKNLERHTQYTQPLNDEPKPRPRGRSSSVATSTASSKSSMSIKEAFARVPKPYSRSGAEIGPFVVPEIKKKKTRETHDEADMQVFTSAFRAAQKTVNFTDEHEYLDTYLSWRVENDAAGPLPCLHKGTGCNAKREQMLRLSKEDSSNLVKVLVTTESDVSTLDDANQRCAEAESFLTLAVAARVPVPLGRVEGVWSLYCPKYSDTHVDKYGFGKRTLTISSIAGFKSSTYTARLCIPPRPMAYNILAFNAPPHASFRTTIIKTSAEGYKMEVIFLGNGYLHLRVDLHLLLMGKPMESADGKPVTMEFIGVHEHAVQWKEKKDELEETGRKLFAKYDGGVSED